METFPNIHLLLENTKSNSLITIERKTNNLSQTLDFYNKLSLSLTNKPLENRSFKYRNLTINFSESTDKEDSLWLLLKLSNLENIVKKIKANGLEPFREYENLKDKYIVILRINGTSIELVEDLTK